MPVSTYALTGTLSDLVGSAVDPTHTIAWVETNSETGGIVDTNTSGEILLGAPRIDVADDGTFSIALPTTNGLTIPTAFQYRVWVEYRTIFGGKVKKERWTSGWFSFTAAKNLKDVVEESYAPPTYLTQLTTALDAHEAGLEADLTTHASGLQATMDTTAADVEADRLEVVALRAGITGDLGMTDSQAATLVNDDVTPSLLRTALNTAIEEQAVPRSLAPIILDSSYSTTATLDALLATLTAGAVLEIPPGVTINRSTPITFPVPMTIKGDGTLKDTRAVPTNAFINIGPAASGSKVLCRLQGSVSGTYVGNHYGVAILGTDNGAATAPTFVTDITIDSPEVSGFGSIGIRGEFVKDSRLDVAYAHDLGYAGVIVSSADNVTSRVGVMSTITPGVVSQCYGVQFDRRDASSDLVRYPASKNFAGHVDVAQNSPLLRLVGTHGGKGGRLSFGAAYGVRELIDVVSSSDSTGQFCAPENITFFGGYGDSAVTDGSGRPGLVVTGCYVSGAVSEYAKGVSGRIDTMVGFGVESDVTQGAFYAHSTQGFDVTLGNVREPSPYAATLYHDNKDFVLRLGSVMDPWSETAAHAGLVNVPSANNNGWILSASATRGSKTVSGSGKLNTRGLNVLNDATNVIRLGHVADFSSATAPITGPVTSPYVRPLVAPVGSAAAPAYVFDGDTDTGFYWVASGDIGVVSNGTRKVRFQPTQMLLETDYKLTTAASSTAAASARLPHGTAPTSPSNGDMWTTTAGLYVRINGVTVGPLS